MFASDSSPTAAIAGRLRAPLWLALAALLLKLAIGIACLGADDAWASSTAAPASEAACVAGEASCHGDCSLVATPAPLAHLAPQMLLSAHVLPTRAADTVAAAFEESLRPPIA